MDELVTWLGAQLDARSRELDGDERAAKASDPARHREIVTETLAKRVVGTHRQAGHIARWDPARVLREVEIGRAEVEATRRILALYGDQVRRQAENSALFVLLSKQRYLDQAEFTRVKTHGWELGGRIAALTAVIRPLALPYAGQPGYQAEWRPDDHA